MKTTSSDSTNYRTRHQLMDSVFLTPNGTGCKNIGFVVTKSDPKVSVKGNTDIIFKPEKEPLLKIHGNILYNYNYRSYIDTPFTQNGMMQHMLQAYVDADIANKYPVRAIFTYRASNTPYYSNSSGVSIQYRQSDMLEQIKSDLRKDADSALYKNSLINPSLRYKTDQLNKLNELSVPSLANNIFNKSIIDSLYNIYEQKRNNLDVLEAQKNKINGPQAIVEAREAQLFKKPNLDSLSDSLKLVEDIWDNGSKKNGEAFKGIENDTLLINKVIKKSFNDSDEVKIKQREDSILRLKKELASIESKIVSLQKKNTDSLLMVKRKINQLNNPEALRDYINQNDTAENERLTKAQKFLLSVDQISIGRSWINYSELTVKNISLNGFNVEINPGKLYMAAAIGSINSDFKNFILNNNTAANQSVKLIRVGVGKKNKNSLILTVYGGRKAILNTTGLDSSSSTTQKIIGASLTGTVVVTKNTIVTAEVARSSYSDIYNPGQNNKGAFRGVLNFGMRTNEAWNIKFQSFYPRTNTKIDGSYSSIGAAFQSFTIYTPNVKQNAYVLHVNQLLWKKRLSVDGAIRKNDFNSPLTAPGYSNSAIFKSLQLSLAIPRYPFVSVGYYPTSQLFAGSGNVLYQSWYNTLNGIVSYSYKASGLNMTTNAVFTKFYNKQSDSSFIYYNASTFTLSHSVDLQPFILEANLVVTDQDSVHLVTVEPVVTYKYKNVLTLSGSVKWSVLNATQTLWGGTAGVGILIKNIGTIQLNYEKVYLPRYSGTLMAVDMGRVTFNKVF